MAAASPVTRSGRGYKVALAEMNDFASGTSSGATKLIHGGLRYLEHYEFRLVRESLMEREVLWAMAPHIIWPLRFVLLSITGAASARPGSYASASCSIDHTSAAASYCPSTATLNMKTDPAGKPLKALFTKAFEYSDGWVDDARMVVLNARDAADRGATIMPRTKVISARREGAIWAIETQDTVTGERRAFQSRMLVNAAGPWVDHVLSDAFGKNQVHNVRLVRAAISSSVRSSTTRAPISSRIRITASSSPSPMSRISP